MNQLKNMLFNNFDPTKTSSKLFIPAESTELYVKGLIEVEGKQLSDQSKQSILELVDRTSHLGLASLAGQLSAYDIKTKEAPLIWEAIAKRLMKEK
jgi:hypothetical protein